MRPIEEDLQKILDSLNSAALNAIEKIGDYEASISDDINLTEVTDTEYLREKLKEKLEDGIQNGC